MSRLVENPDPLIWDAMVIQSRHATIFHTSAWLDVVKDRWNKLLIFDEDEEPVAGCVVEKEIYRREHGNTITPYVGPLLKDHSYSGALKSKNDFCLLEIFEKALVEKHPVKFTSSPWLEDLRPFVIGRWNIGLLYTNILKEHQLYNLDQSMSSHCHKKIRSVINKRLVPKIDDKPNEAAIKKILDLAACSYERQSLKLRFNRPETELAFKAMSDLGRVFFVFGEEPSGDISCGVGIFEYKNRAHYLISGQDRAVSSAGSVNLILYEAIKHARTRGAKEFDFEGSFLAGVDSFFREYGGTPQPFYEVSSPG